METPGQEADSHAAPPVTLTQASEPTPLQRDRGFARSVPGARVSAGHLVTHNQWAPRWKVLTRDALDDLPEPRDLIQGVLPERGLAMLAGSRGLGKSLLALDVVAHVAVGLPNWCGRNVRVKGSVLYVAREGFAGVPERVRAWELNMGQRCEQVLWLPEPMDLKRSRDAECLAALASEHGVAVVVVDSARATGAGAEDTKDMSKYVEGLEIVQDAFGGLVLTLHNTGWDATRERGSTLLPDACDTTLLLTGSSCGVRRLENRKYRDGEPFSEPLGFEFLPVAGTVSGVLSLCSASRPGTIRDRLLNLIEAEPGLTSSDLARRADANRSNVSSALTRMARDGLILNSGGAQRPSWEVVCEEASIKT